MTNKTERWAAALQIGPVFNVNESRMSDTADYHSSPASAAVVAQLPTLSLSPLPLSLLGDPGQPESSELCMVSFGAQWPTSLEMLTTWHSDLLPMTISGSIINPANAPRRSDVIMSAAAPYLYITLVDLRNQRR